MDCGCGTTEFPLGPLILVHFREIEESVKAKLALASAESLGNRPTPELINYRPKPSRVFINSGVKESGSHVHCYMTHVHRQNASRQGLSVLRTPPSN